MESVKPLVEAFEGAHYRCVFCSKLEAFEEAEVDRFVLFLDDRDYGMVPLLPQIDPAEEPTL